MLRFLSLLGCTKIVQTKCGSVETIENIEPEFGGASQDRTDDLIVANDALSQLSYSPTPRRDSLTRTGRVIVTSWRCSANSRRAVCDVCAARASITQRDDAACEACHARNSEWQLII